MADHDPCSEAVAGVKSRRCDGGRLLARVLKTAVKLKCSKRQTCRHPGRRSPVRTAEASAEDTTMEAELFSASRAAAAENLRQPPSFTRQCSKI